MGEVQGRFINGIAMFGGSRLAEGKDGKKWSEGWREQPKARRMARGRVDWGKVSKGKEGKMTTHIGSGMVERGMPRLDEGRGRRGSLRLGK